VSARTPLLVANWKMYKTVAESRVWAERFREAALREGLGQGRELVVAPTAPSLWVVATALDGTGVGLAAQNLDLGVEGALTGAVSGYLLRQAGAEWVILGHSERRQHFGESDQLVAEKVLAAVAAGLEPIVCIGETEEERRAGKTQERLFEQLSPVVAAAGRERWAGVVIAYEPVWAIGSGRTPTPEVIDEIAGSLRSWLGQQLPGVGEATRILYGGSVNEQNLASFWNLEHIDGALVGGASLDVERFVAMAKTPLGAKEERR
jgi:triosephosphate isomerase